MNKVTTPVADMLTSLADKKADIALVAPAVFKKYDISNPGKLQKVVADHPFYVFNVGFGLKPDEPGIKNFFDYMIRNLAANGYLDDLYKKYDPDGFLLRPALPYQPAS